MLAPFTLVIAQAASPTPSASPSVPLAISWPARVKISSASATNFSAFNHDGFGSIILTIGCDGIKNPFIPPTRDIDADLKSALAQFVDQTVVIVGRGCEGKAFLIRFKVPSGDAKEIELLPPQH